MTVPRCGRPTGAALFSPRTARAILISTKKSRAGAATMNYFWRLDLINFRPVSLRTGDSSSTRPLIPRRSLICGSYHCLEIGSRFHFYKLSSPRVTVNSPLTGDGLRTPRMNPEKTRFMWRLFQGREISSRSPPQAVSCQNGGATGKRFFIWHLITN